MRRRVFWTAFGSGGSAGFETDVTSLMISPCLVEYEYTEEGGKANQQRSDQGRECGLLPGKPPQVDGPVEFHSGGHLLRQFRLKLREDAGIDLVNRLSACAILSVDFLGAHNQIARADDLTGIVRPQQSSPDTEDGHQRQHQHHAKQNLGG
jgi:hypothetical protein